MYEKHEAPLMCRIFGHKITYKTKNGRKVLTKFSETKLIPYCARCGYSFMADPIARIRAFTNSTAMQRDSQSFKEQVK